MTTVSLSAFELKSPKSQISTSIANPSEPAHPLLMLPGRADPRVLANISCCQNFASHRLLAKMAAALQGWMAVGAAGCWRCGSPRKRYSSFEP